MAMPEAMIVGCRETSSGEIDPSNSTRLVDLANNADAVLLGPGLVDEAPVAELRSELLSRVTGSMFVLDASAFTSLRTSRGVVPTHRRRTIVTPHSGEMAKFLQIDKQDIEADPLAAARSVTRRGVPMQVIARPIIAATILLMSPMTALAWFKRWVVTVAPCSR